MSLKLLNINLNNALIESKDDTSSFSLGLVNNNINENFNFLSTKKLFCDSCNESTEQSIKSISPKKYRSNSIYKRFQKENLFKKKIRKDLYGNIIEKGGKHKVSFIDDIKGKYLVEMTLYNSEDNSLRKKNYQDYTIKREARDKGGVICSTCNIF